MVDGGWCRDSRQHRSLNAQSLSETQHFSRNSGKTISKPGQNTAQNEAVIINWQVSGLHGRNFKLTNSNRIFGSRLNCRTVLATFMQALAITATAALANSPAAWGEGAREGQRFGIGLEAGPVGFTRNDIRIPGDTGTEFDMTRLTGSGPAFFARIDGHWDINDKHGLRLVLAPLEVSGSGNLREDTVFADELFSAGETEGRYTFNTYKLTYRYTFVDKPKLRWRVGFTGVIRDADVELRQGDLRDNDDNVGFVPALHLSSDYSFADRWTLRFDFDGLAGGPGRLFDVALKVDYAVSDNWRIGGGYRTLEGGADTDDVYSFGWLHYGVFDIRYQF
jgi:hypothetical protein